MKKKKTALDVAIRWMASDNNCRLCLIPLSSEFCNGRTKDCEKWIRKYLIMKAREVK